MSTITWEQAITKAVEAALRADQIEPRGDDNRAQWAIDRAEAWVSVADSIQWHETLMDQAIKDLRQGRQVKS